MTLPDIEKGINDLARTTGADPQKVAAAVRALRVAFAGPLAYSDRQSSSRKAYFDAIAREARERYAAANARPDPNELRRRLGMLPR